MKVFRGIEIVNVNDFVDRLKLGPSGDR
jgi:hypothetical protein